MDNKHIHVTCAIVEKDGLVLAAQRSASMKLPYKWEFPGGKVHEGESKEDCLRREIVEEMGVNIFVGKKLSPCTHKYSDFTVTLYPYVCEIENGEIVLHEHADISWLPAEKLRQLNWAEADLPVLEEYLQQTPQI